MVEQLAVKILQLSVERRIEKRGEFGEALRGKTQGNPEPSPVLQQGRRRDYLFIRVLHIDMGEAPRPLFLIKKRGMI